MSDPTPYEIESASPFRQMLPQDPAAESGALGAMLLDSRALALAQERRASPEWFHLPAHQTIFSALEEMSGEGKPVDTISLTGHLRDTRRLDAVGGAVAVMELFRHGGSPAYLPHYLDTLEEKWKSREIIRCCTTHAARAYDEQDDVPGLMESLERDVSRIRASRITTGTHSARKLAIEAVNYIQAVHERRGAIGGISTGFMELDKMIDGLHGGELVVIGARPSMGKTALAMQIAEHIGIEEKKHVAIFSLEMNAAQLMQRVICSRARVNMYRVRDGILSERDFPALQAAAEAWASGRFHFETGSGMQLSEIRSKLTRLKEEFDIKAAFIDSAKKIRVRGLSGHEEAAAASGGVKDIANDLDISLTVVAHLTREAAKNGRPGIESLGGSDGWATDPDVTLMLTRESLLADSDEAADVAGGASWLRVAKSRMGAMGEKVPLEFVSEFCRFETREVDEYAPSETKPEPSQAKRRSGKFGGFGR